MSLVIQIKITAPRIATRMLQIMPPAPTCGPARNQPNDDPPDESVCHRGLRVFAGAILLAKGSWENGADAGAEFMDQHTQR